MRINEKQFSEAILIIANCTNREMMFALYKDKAMTYTDLMNLVKKIKGGGGNSGKYAYYIKKLQDRKMIKKESHYYFLTRIGLAVTRMAYDLQKECMEYDLDDCDADGKIMVIVKRK